MLAKVQEGVEVIVEQNHRPVATIKPPKRSGRPISECIASAKASGSKVMLDGGFGNDVEEGIRERSEPWNPPPGVNPRFQHDHRGGTEAAAG